MTESSPVLIIFLLSSWILVIGVVVFFVIRHYLHLRTTPIYVSIPILIALVTSASAIVLVPLDVASTDITHYPWMVTISEEVLLVLWRICYWMTFALTWVILPGIGEYVDSGFYETKDKMSYSLRSNMQYHLIVACVGLLFSLYFFSAVGFKLDSMKALVMAGAYLWGLLLACYLMGHGLITFPRHYFRKAYPEIRRLSLDRAEEETKLKLQRAESYFAQHDVVVNKLIQQKHNIHPNFHPWIDQLNTETIAYDVQSPAQTEPYTSVPSVVTKEFLARITRGVRLEGTKVARYRVGLKRIQNALNQLEYSPESGSPIDGTRLWLGLPGGVWNDCHKMFYYILPYLNFCFALILSFFSAMIIISQTVALFDPSSTPVAWFTGRFRGYWLLPVLMFHSALSAISSLPRGVPLATWKIRYLTPGATALESAVFFASQVARLSMPLALNYSSLLPRSVYRDMVFYKFLGVKVDLTPVGGAFAKFAPPTVVLLSAIAAHTGAFGWVKTWFKPRDDRETTTDGYRGGTARPDGRSSRYYEGSDQDSTYSSRNSHLPLTSTSAHRPRPRLSSLSFNGGLVNVQSDGQYTRFIDRGVEPPTFSNSVLGGLSSALQSPITQRGPRTGNQAGIVAGVGNFFNWSSSDDTRHSPVEDPSWFSEFGHRVRNTVETVAPTWLGGERDGRIRLEEEGNGSSSTNPWGWRALFGGAGEDSDSDSSITPSRRVRL